MWGKHKKSKLQRSGRGWVRQVQQQLRRRLIGLCGGGARAEMTLPNSFHVLPSNFSNCICLTGAKSVGLVDNVMPGRSMGRAKLCKLAACFMMFSRAKIVTASFEHRNYGLCIRISDYSLNVGNAC